MKTRMKLQLTVAAVTLGALAAPCAAQYVVSHNRVFHRTSLTCLNGGGPVGNYPYMETCQPWSVFSYSATAGDRRNWHHVWYSEPAIDSWNVFLLTNNLLPYGQRAGCMAGAGQGKRVRTEACSGYWRPQQRWRLRNHSIVYRDVLGLFLPWHQYQIQSVQWPNLCLFTYGNASGVTLETCDLANGPRARSFWLSS